MLFNEITEDEINKIFSKYVPEGLQTDCPEYKATPIEAGPKAITIEEYRRRQKKRPETPVEAPVKRRKKRGGQKVKNRQKLAELHRIIVITTDKELKKSLLQQLQEVKAQAWATPNQDQKK